MQVERSKNAEPVRKASAKRVGSSCDNGCLVVGLTGGIASGKSTVAVILRELGAEVISADAIVHDLLANDVAVSSSIVAAFGNCVLDSNGGIDRAVLGGIVFGDGIQRAKLESIIHPTVLERLTHEVALFRQDSCGVLVLEIPLLVEVDAFGLVDKVLVVVAEQETQIGRLVKRDSLSREAALARIGAQMPLSEKAKYGDWVVDTDSGLDATKQQLYKVWAEVQQLLAQQA